MKRKLYLGLALFLTLTSPTFASYSLPDLVGVWEGSYTATQGETGLTLTVWEENGNYRAIFYFYNLPDRTNAKEGSYYMTVTSNNPTILYKLVGTKWIKKPKGWVFVDLEGTVNGNVFTGTVFISSGSIGNFLLIKKSETENTQGD